MHEGLPRPHPSLNIIWKQIQGLLPAAIFACNLQAAALLRTLRRKKRVTLFLAEGPFPLTAATRPPHSGPFGKHRGQSNVIPPSPPATGKVSGQQKGFMLNET